MNKLSAIRSFVPELILLIAMGVLYSLNLGVFDIEPTSELFHIEAAKETVGAGHFWIPFLQGHEYLARSPVWIWLVNLCFDTLGVSLWAARVPAVVFSLLGLGLTYMLSLELTKSRFSAFFAAAVLGTSWGYFHLASLSTADVLTVDLYLGFLWAFVQWHSFAERRHTIPLEMNLFSAVMGVLLGVLLLAKGMISVLVLVAVAMLFLVLNQDLERLSKLKGSLFALPILLVPLPWLIGASISSGNSLFIFHYLFTQPVQQLFGTGPWEGLHGDVFFYLRQLPFDLLPYLIFLPALVMDGFFFHRRGIAQPNQWPLWLTLWFALGFVVYSLSAFQEASLLLPFYPAFAILVGAYLGQAMEGTTTTPPVYENMLTGVILTLMGIAVLFAILIFQVLPNDYVSGFWQLPGQSTLAFLDLGKHRIDLTEVFPLWKFWLIPGPFILLIGGLTVFTLQAGRRMTVTPLAVMSTFVLFLLFLKLVYLPILNRPVPQLFASRINQQAKAGDEVLLYSFHPDVKRVWFYLRYNPKIPVHFVQKPEKIAQTLDAKQDGTVFGVIREKSYFNDLDYGSRYRLQIRQFNWKWDMGHLSELKKLFVVRAPLFENMKSDMISFQSLPKDAVDATASLPDLSSNETMQQPQLMTALTNIP